MRICIVLGAGASYANAKHFRPKRLQSSLPPLDYSFFPKVRELEIEPPAALLSYAHNLPTGSPFDQEDARMELFLRDLFHDFLSQKNDNNSEGVQAYRQMVRIYVDVLRQTTDWMRRDNYAGGPIGRLLAAAMDAADVVDVITFNHDLVIENEIYKRARLRNRWCVSRGYGSFGLAKDQYLTGGQPLFPDHSAECDHSVPLRIHKMHGSLNWFIKTRSQNPTPSVLAGEVESPDILILRDRNLRNIKTVSTGAPKGRSSWWVWPVIVPPIYAKQSLISAFMPSVWADAREALVEADRVLFYGYSMPQADIEAEKLFQRAISDAPRLKWVDIVDPSTEAVTRYADVLPRIPLRRYPNGDSLLGGSIFE